MKSVFVILLIYKINLGLRTILENRRTFLTKTFEHHDVITNILKSNTLSSYINLEQVQIFLILKEGDMYTRLKQHA